MTASYGLLAFCLLLQAASSDSTSINAVAPALGSLETFAVLAGTTVTNTGITTVTGDLGIFSGSSLTGMGIGTTGTIIGNTYLATAQAGAAQGDLTVAYNSATGQASGATLSNVDLGGLILSQGVYTFDAAAQLSAGELTLTGDANSIFIFQIGTALTITGSVELVNVLPSNIYWQVGSSATINDGSAMKGNILAHVSITFKAGATLDGRALASTGAVTFISNTVTNPLSTPVDHQCGCMGTNTFDPAVHRASVTSLVCF
jgi:hypothetical protein